MAQQWLRTLPGRQRGTRHPAVMVFQEAFGVNGHIREVCQRFAREGFLAVAPELFHQTAPGFEGSYDDFQSTHPRISALTNDNLERDILATYVWIHAQPEVQEERIASIGFCMGGVGLLSCKFVRAACGRDFILWWWNRTGKSWSAEKIQMPTLFFWGGRAQHIGWCQIASVTAPMKNTDKSFANVVFSGGHHSFFSDDCRTYHRKAATEGWALTLTFMDESVDPSGPSKSKYRA